MSIIVYIFYLSRVVLSTRDDNILLLPNFWFTITCALLMFILTLISQGLYPVEYTRQWIIIRMALAAIPTFLGFVMTLRWIKEQRKQNTEFIVYAGGILFALIFGVLTILYLILLLLLFILGEIPGHSIYLFTLGMWGMLGMTLGDLKIFSNVDNKLAIKKSRNYFENLFLNALILLEKIYISRKRRFITLFFISCILIVLLWLTDSTNVHPISI